MSDQVLRCDNDECRIVIFTMQSPKSRHRQIEARICPACMMVARYDSRGTPLGALSRHRLKTHFKIADPECPVCGAGEGQPCPDGIECSGGGF